MSTRARRAGRRTWVYVGDPRRKTSCVIWGQPRPGRWADWAVVHSAHAYEVTCLLKLPTERSLQWDLPWRAEIPREIQGGQRGADLIAGDVVYAFYSRPSHAVKIGRTTDLLRRWSKLEAESGQLRQLIGARVSHRKRNGAADTTRSPATHKTIPATNRPNDQGKGIRPGSPVALAERRAQRRALDHLDAGRSCLKRWAS